MSLMYGEVAIEGLFISKTLAIISDISYVKIIVENRFRDASLKSNINEAKIIWITTKIMRIQIPEETEIRSLFFTHG